VGLFISPEDWRYCHAQYKDFLDRKIECDLVIEQHQARRTMPMNDMWEGMVRKIAKETRHTFDQVRNYMKETWGVYEKIVVPVHAKDGIAMQEKHVQKSTARYTIQEMSDLIMGTFEFGADCGVDLTVEKKDYDTKKKELLT
jgi:hypothetical protein